MASEESVVPATVLMVCTGNVCRSPLAEALLRRRLAELGVTAREVVVGSAGVRALAGDPMTSQAQRELTRLAGKAEAFRSRQLVESMVRDADLVLTAERAHRSVVVQLVPRALRYTFTLRELHRLMDDADLAELPASAADRVRALPRLASARKGMVAATAADDDIADPYRRSDADYARTTRQLEPAVSALADVIAGRR